MALSGAFVAAGYRGAAFVPCSEIPRSFHAKWRWPDFNPTVSTPMALLARWMPYVKVLLIRDNPGRMTLESIYEVLDVSVFDRSLIEVDPRRSDFDIPESPSVRPARK